MATTRSFSDMLNEYLTYDLLKEELLPRDWLLNAIEKDNSWKGGTLVVPFQGAKASSIKLGGLTSESDISEYDFVRGSVSGYKEAWGSLLFNQRDVDEHMKAGEQSFLKGLEPQIDDFMNSMKEHLSMFLLNGPHFDKATADGTAGGLITVNRPERFEIGQKVTVDDADSASVDGYVKDININTKVLHIVTTRGGAVDVDLSPYTVAQSAKVYTDGAITGANQFQSLRDALLSAANGGGASLHGQTKLSFPYLQAINIAGSSITATNILDKIFDAYTVGRERGKGNPNKIVMSYKHLGSVMKVLETSKQAFRQASDTKQSLYGYTTIEIVGVKGGLEVIGVHEMDDDIILGLDLKGIKLHSNDFFKIRKSPEGLMYHTLRATTGYSYIVDLCFYGELVVSRPSHQFIIHTISY